MSKKGEKKRKLKLGGACIVVHLYFRTNWELNISCVLTVYTYMLSNLPQEVTYMLLSLFGKDAKANNRSQYPELPIAEAPGDQDCT